MARHHRSHHREPEPIRITTAAASRDEDIASRQKAYLISMGIRALCFVGAGVSALAGVNWLWPILIVGALVLPYVAVVMANVAHTKGDDFTLDDSPFGRPQLGPPPPPHP
jgi:hypothetical protein